MFVNVMLHPKLVSDNNDLRKFNGFAVFKATTKSDVPSATSKRQLLAALGARHVELVSFVTNHSWCSFLTKPINKSDFSQPVCGSHTC